jgi:hypothetical protein
MGQNKKYKLGESKDFYGKTLFKVVALISFCDVSVGDIGGWVESEKNLSQVYGDAWVYGDAQVYGNARVYGDAWVYGDAQVYGNARVYGDAISTKSVNCLQSKKYFISISDNFIQIGCQNHSIEEWGKFDDEKIESMDSGALAWWATWKPIIFSIINVY